MTFRIRCSALPSWSECARRTAAKNFRGLVEEKGFEVRRLKPTVAAAIGTTVHHVAAVAMRKRRGDSEPGEADQALAGFAEEIAPGAEWDDTTPNRQAADAQISSLTAAYLTAAEDFAAPVLVEELLRGGAGDGWELTGTLDLLDADGRVDDLKTGALSRPYFQQVGGYVLLAKANGHGVREVGITFIKRVKTGKPQPPAVRTTFDLDVATRSAWAVIEDVRRSIERFAGNGDPYELRANPMSLMCSERYCPAWGTEFCKVHLAKGE